MTVEEYLEQIDRVIEKGPFKDTWESLADFEIPRWYQKAKFGIFTHWGVYSVPEYHGEWYPSWMYVKDSDVYNYHIKTYGNQKDFAYTDFIPMFTAKKFNPKEWLDLFEEAGAKYYMPVAEHHDGFQMYDSELSIWNSVNMGPHRDVIGELKAETEKRGMVFCASSHRAENYWFMGWGRDFDSGIQDIEYQEPYGYAKKLFERKDQGKGTRNIYYQGPNKGHLENWLARTCELVDKYRPQIIWFDWYIQNLEFKPYLKKFAAYYYNRGVEWNLPVAINHKDDSYARGTAVFDMERGQTADIRPLFWQTDTATTNRFWSYTKNNVYKTPESIVCDLIDIVSKNGALLLNVGPRADGSIGEEDVQILKAIGKWMKINGESIYDTSYWAVFGEGPTEVIDGAFQDSKRAEFTSQDVRYTYKSPYLYVNVLKSPENQKISLAALRSIRNKIFKGHVDSISVLGFENVDANFDRDEFGLHITLSQKIETTFPICLKIKID